MNTEAGAEVDVAIVGGGPRAVSVVERLGARAMAGAPPLRVAIIDAVEVGAGATWRTDQSPLLLNNTYSGHTTIYPDESTALSGPLRTGHDLVAWATASDAPSGRPAWAAEEIAEILPWSYPSRRLQGVYYREQLDRCAASGRLTVSEYRGTAVDLVAEQDRRVVRLADGRSIAARTVVLAQGMVQSVRSRTTQGFVDAAEAHGLVYIEPGMPAERDWDAVPAGETVLVTGLGANFFDVVALLTEGRGGRFEPAGGPGPVPRLRYVASGREPHLVAGSRRGLPYRSKAAYPDGFPPPYRLRLATPEWFAQVATTPLQDFRTAIWPQLAREFAWAHLSTLLAHHQDALAEGLDEDALLRALAQAPLSGINAVVADAVTDTRRHLDVHRLDRPAPSTVFTPAAWQEWVARYLAEEQETINSPLTHPRNTVNRAMAVLRGSVQRLLTIGAIDGRSVVADVNGWFDALGLALASGPPPGRSAQVHALIEAGVLELLGEGTTVTVEDGLFVGRASGVAREPVRARAFIETRMSKGKIATTDDPLLRGLLGTGRARLHRLPTRDGAFAQDSSLDVTADGFHLLDAEGRADAQVIVLGIPAEGVQPNSAIGATPGVPSPLIAGADIAAAQVYAQAAPTAAAPSANRSTEPRRRAQDVSARIAACSRTASRQDHGPAD
ncbi:FAD/NAD(P)-binding protein [Actinomadura verrucosospora]|uniref:Fad-nad-binding family protein n=1 Tax=Actinomadura verrucosospora TaxID=46165 RepID=A0A7D3ZYS7_ACTVE|nr:FAD/NAD(P)-binding protein [Actinomadura verrucosospora]QKG21564.1 fad-nad-binding family protein [Actinomadura verrucosospora]